MAEVIYGKRRRKQYWLLTTDPETLPDNSTTFVMVAAPAIKLSEIGNSYGFRTWIEYGLKQAKDALGWADFRMTHYEQIEKWWEMVMSAFLMVSLFADAFNNSCPIAHQQFAGASVVEQSKWLETSAQQFALDNSTINLFQLVKAMVRGVSYCFIAVWI